MEKGYIRGIKREIKGKNLGFKSFMCSFATDLVAWEFYIIHTCVVNGSVCLLSHPLVSLEYINIHIHTPWSETKGNNQMHKTRTEKSAFIGIY